MATKGSFLTGLQETLKQDWVDTKRQSIEHSKHIVLLHPEDLGVRKTNLFNSWYKLLGDVGSNGLVFKLQLGAMLHIKRLKNSNDLPVLAGATCLFLMSVVKPKKEEEVPF